MTDLLQVRKDADALGIPYHHRAGAAKIQALIDAHEPQMDDSPDLPGPVLNRVPVDPVIPMTAEKFNRDRLAQNRKRVAQLVRCRVTCMNPNKKEWPGEIISVGSAKLGTFKKYVPFNTGEPYHLPRIIFDVLKEKKCSVFFNETNAQGHKVRKSRLINEYALDELPRLTKEELKDLEQRQAMAKGGQVTY